MLVAVVVIGGIFFIAVSSSSILDRIRNMAKSEANSCECLLIRYINIISFSVHDFSN